MGLDSLSLPKLESTQFDDRFGLILSRDAAEVVAPAQGGLNAGRLLPGRKARGFDPRTFGVLNRMQRNDLTPRPGYGAAVVQSAAAAILFSVARLDRRAERTG
jgi:hypothetical protein